MDDAGVWSEEFAFDEFFDQFDGDFDVAFEVVGDVVVGEFANFGCGGHAGVVDEDV